jgi:hypothetical protein
MQIKTALAAILVAACAISARAGEVYARTLATMGTSTNASWTVGKYERPTVKRIDCVGATASSTCTVAIVYGDSAAGTRVVGTVTNDASGNSTISFIGNELFLQANDILYMGRLTATNGAWRVHYIQRDTRAAN